MNLTEKHVVTFYSAIITAPGLGFNYIYIWAVLSRHKHVMVMGRQELNPVFPLKVTARQPLVFLATSWTPTTANNEMNHVSPGESDFYGQLR